MKSDNVAIAKLGTEQRHAAAAELDRMPALEIAQLINREDANVAAAVRRALPQIAEAIDAIAVAINDGGRLIYVGAGTSGRIAALDASEIPPTFNTDPKTVTFVIAGGERALAHATEASEDSSKLGIADIKKKRPTKKDVVVGLAASGRTPYTVAAIKYARQRGAKTVAVTCNRGSELGRAAEIEIVAEVGPELVSGSSRMKAGTAQKMICNMLTTGAMARLGYVYGNLMVNVHTKNEKLVARGLTILVEAAGASLSDAEAALQAAKMHVPTALVMLMARVSAKEARQRLKSAKNNVRRAIGDGV